MTEISDEILDKLNEFLFEAFFTISAIYAENLHEMKALLLGCINLETMQNIIDASTKLLEEASSDLSEEERLVINDLSAKILALSNLAHARTEQINALSLFDGHQIQDNESKILSSYTKIGIQTLVEKIEREILM